MNNRYFLEKLVEQNTDSLFPLQDRFVVQYLMLPFMSSNEDDLGLYLAGGEL